MLKKTKLNFYIFYHSNHECIHFSLRTVLRKFIIFTVIYFVINKRSLLYLMLYEFFKFKCHLSGFFNDRYITLEPQFLD